MGAAQAAPRQHLLARAQLEHRLPARKFVYDNGAFMFHFTKYNDGYCTSKPSDSQQPKFFDAIHEKAWRLGSDHYQARQSMWKMQKDAQTANTAFPAAQHRSPP